MGKEIIISEKECPVSKILFENEKKKDEYKKTMIIQYDFYNWADFWRSCPILRNHVKKLIQIYFNLKEKIKMIGSKKERNLIKLKSNDLIGFHKKEKLNEFKSLKNEIIF